MVSRQNKVQAGPDELRNALQQLQRRHPRKWDPVRFDEAGLLVFFPFWPLGRQGYSVPNEATAAELRESHRRLLFWSKISIWVPAALCWIFLVAGVPPGWLFLFFALDLFALVAALFAWRRGVVRDLDRAPSSGSFTYRHRLEARAVSSRLPLRLLLIASAALVLVLSLSCLWFARDRALGDFGGLPYWAGGVILRGIGLMGAALSGLTLAALGYQVWYLVARREEVRLRRREARLWG
jgi:hypothetical protein